MTTKKPQRADAMRNRARILDVAERVFAERGLETPMPEVAREIGVGVGTVYRHFPTKEALFGAILVDRMEAVVARTRSLAEAADPRQAFRDMFAYLVEQSLRNKALFAALSEASGVELGVSSELGGALREAERALLARAQKAGAVRQDVDVSDLKALISGCLTMASQSRNPARMVDVVCDGLQP